MSGKNLSIDGKEIPFVAGETILEAAGRAGVRIPTLCHDPRVTPGGSCRLCLVEANGRSVPACAFPSEPGAAVRTETPGLAAFRRNLLELTLSELPDGPCPRCDEGVPCQLHALARDLGARPGRFAGARSGTRPPDANPLILRDYTQCISCYRCTRVCNELEQAHAITPAGRGFASRIASYGNLGEKGLSESPCTFCGQCINTCPTGALLERPRAGRPATPRADRTVKTTCPYCGTGCSLLLEVAGDRIVGARGDPDSPVNRGSLCIKGQFGWEFAQDPERLTAPLIREGDGFRRASWDEVLDLVAERFSAIKRECGPDALVFWSSARATSESNYVFQKLARAAVGTNNIDNCART